MTDPVPTSAATVVMNTRKPQRRDGWLSRCAMCRCRILNPFLWAKVPAYPEGPIHFRCYRRLVRGWESTDAT